MATITPKMVKELREKTGAGMMDCKKALAAVDGDEQKAIDYLREKGIAKAAKKSGRIAAEGAVAAYVSDDKKTGVLFELNCETDFAAKNAEFKALQSKLMKLIADKAPESVEELEGLKLDGKSITDVMGEATATIGEKLSIRRFERYETEGELTSYIHMGGKIGVLVDIIGGNDQLGKDVAMQIAASVPLAVDRAGVKADDLEHEKEVLRKQALEEGKPEKIVDRMVEGRINKFYKEVCLLEQDFVKADPSEKKTVKDILGKAKVVRFVRYQLGEGIEKKKDDFAAEVAAQVAGSAK